jgi:hypothetical protein
VKRRVAPIKTTRAATFLDNNMASPLMSGIHLGRGKDNNIADCRLPI